MKVNHHFQRSLINRSIQPGGIEIYILGCYSGLTSTLKIYSAGVMDVTLSVSVHG